MRSNRQNTKNVKFMISKTLYEISLNKTDITLSLFRMLQK